MASLRDLLCFLQITLCLPILSVPPFDFSKQCCPGNQAKNQVVASATLSQAGHCDVETSKKPLVVPLNPDAQVSTHRLTEYQVGAPIAQTGRIFFQIAFEAFESLRAIHLGCRIMAHDALFAQLTV